MNHLAEQPLRNTETNLGYTRHEQEWASAPQPETGLRSFNPVAAVTMLRYDLQSNGSVRPETREQVQNEQLSYLVEGVDRAACTEFVFRRQEGAMQYFKDGVWRPYDDMLMTGLQAAKAEAAHDYRRRFLVDWASNDIYNALQMQKLQPGEQRVWISSYPHEEAKRYGAAFMRECGLNPSRELGFIYRAVCNDQGEIVLQSQTVDRSDQRAFASVMQAAAHDPRVEMYGLVGAYDTELSRTRGKQFYAGRLEGEVRENAWDTLRRQHDLVGYLMTKLESIAASGLQGKVLEDAVKRHIYGVWAAFNNRLDGKSGAGYEKMANGVWAAHYAIVGQEVNQAFHKLASEGRMLVGCGGATFMMRGEDGILAADSDDVFNSIFGSGSKNTKETYKFDKRMHCVLCQAPPADNEPEKMCGPCGLCKACDAKFKDQSVTQTEFDLAA